MKLFLASALDKTLHLFKNIIDDESKTKVAFVANAADPYEGNKWWIDADRDKFKELGYQITEIDIRNISADEFSDVLKNTDILHICGGSVYYFIDLIRKKNLEDIIVKAVKSEEVIYTGTSAGSVVVSQSIKSFSYDEEEKEFIDKVLDKSGLGIIDFGIVPHCNNVAFIDEHKKMMDYMAEDKETLLFIHDHQAVWVSNDSFKIVSAK